MFLVFQDRTAKVVKELVQNVPQDGFNQVTKLIFVLLVFQENIKMNKVKQVVSIV